MPGSPLTVRPVMGCLGWWLHLGHITGGAWRLNPPHPPDHFSGCSPRGFLIRDNNKFL